MARLPAVAVSELAPASRIGAAVSKLAKVKLPFRVTSLLSNVRLVDVADSGPTSEIATGAVASPRVSGADPTAVASVAKVWADR